MGNAIRVFEHQRILVGKTYSGTRFTAKHHRTLARFNERNGYSYFQVGHKSIRFTQYVGVLCLGRLVIEVLPKADRGAPEPESATKWRDALMKMLRVSRRLKLASPTEARLRLRHGTLFDFFVATYLDEVEGLLQRSLAKRYRETEGNLTYFRGRLLVAKQIALNTTHRERSYVAYTAYDQNHLVNQVLLRALNILIELDSSPALRGRARGLRLLFPTVSDRVIQESDFTRVRLSRNTAHCQQALDLARLIILQFTPGVRSGAEDCLALLFDMNSLFEEFVATIAKRIELPNHTITPQNRKVFWPDRKTRPVGARGRTLRPDLHAKATGKAKPKILDTKWKVPKGVSPDSADLKQVFAYNEFFDTDESILLYPRSPQSGEEFRKRVFVGHKHSCSKAYLDLFDSDGAFSIPHIESQLRELILR